MADLPAALKPVKKYIQQARKVEKVNPLVAYYCRMYAVDEAMKLPAIKQKQPEATKALMHILDELEADKKRFPDLDKDTARMKVETFALNVFKHADDEDRNGRANKKTVLSFVAAYIFMEVTKQFGELASDLAEKIKYAKWKAADISKALKEGRVPTPGAFNESEEQEEEVEEYKSEPFHAEPPYRQHHQEPTDDDLLPSLPSNLGLPSAPVAKKQSHPQPAAPKYTPTQDASRYQSTTSVSAGSFVIEPDLSMSRMQALVEGEKLCKHAVSSLRFQEVKTAVEKLKRALSLLLPHENS